MSASYENFCDDMIVAIADAQTGPNLSAVNVDEIYVDKFPECPPTWLQTIIGELVRLGYGSDKSQNERLFLINGAGVRAAEKVRENSKPKTLLARLNSIQRSEWVAIGALIVSCIALFK